MKLTAGGKVFYARRMTRADAHAVCTWRYTGVREIYNVQDDEESAAEFLDGCHFALSERFGGPAVAFVNFGERATLPLHELENIYRDESYTDIALGLAPEKCGKGLGKNIVLAALELCANFFPEDGFRVTVAKDNARAMSIYRRFGFTTIAEFTAEVVYPSNSGTILTKPVPMEILIAPPEALAQIGKIC